MRFKTFAIATPLSLAAWFGLYQLAVLGYGLLASLPLAGWTHAGQTLMLTLLVR